jgi:hypothetical protein
MKNGWWQWLINKILRQFIDLDYRIGFVDGVSFCLSYYLYNKRFWSTVRKYSFIIH